MAWSLTIATGSALVSVAKASTMFAAERARMAASPSAALSPKRVSRSATISRMDAENLGAASVSSFW